MAPSGGRLAIVAMKHEADETLRVAVERARRRAQATGELRPNGTRSLRRPVLPELREFGHRVLTDGSYAEAVEQLGIEDPEIATM